MSKLFSHSLTYDTASSTLIAATEHGVYRLTHPSGVVMKDASSKVLRITNDLKNASVTISWNDEAGVRKIEFINEAGLSRNIGIAQDLQKLLVTHRELAVGIWFMRVIAKDGRVILWKVEMP